MLTATSSLEILETFRVPYLVEVDPGLGGGGRLTSPRGAHLTWLSPEQEEPRRWYRLGAMRLFGALAPAAAVRRALDSTGLDWEPEQPIVDADGGTAASIWRAEDGSAVLPFDPDALVRALVREEYVGASSVMSRARGLYYLMRPALPRRLQMAVRRRFARVQERAAFPAWPAETSLHDFYAYVLRLVEGVYGEPLPSIAPWPAPYAWSVVLTHDVEHLAGYRHVPAVVAVEKNAGVRSAWYFVPERDYRVEDELVRSLGADGFEVGLHGLRHDGRDLAPGAFAERLPAMRAYAERWGAVGFRSPATHRSWDLIGSLPLSHDSSYSDVARYEPQPGGSCTWFPFPIGNLVELPITLPMDHTLFDLLGHESGRAWFEKLAVLRERSGMALLLTHPDYLLEPARLDEYERFVVHVRRDETAWLALPRDVADWWRRRSGSSLTRRGGDWTIEGPAAGDGRVVLGVSGL